MRKITSKTLQAIGVYVIVFAVPRKLIVCICIAMCVHCNSSEGGKRTESRDQRNDRDSSNPVGTQSSPATSNRLLRYVEIVNQFAYQNHRLNIMYFVRFAADSTVTALEVRRQKEQELRNNDLYWQRRLQQQEQQLKQTGAILEQEYNQTVCAMPCDYFRIPKLTT